MIPPAGCQHAALFAAAILTVTLAQAAQMLVGQVCPCRAWRPTRDGLTVKAFSSTSTL
jgi:hypothetical protein